MIQKIRKAFVESHALMNLNYIFKLPRNVMDAIWEFLPFVYALVVRHALEEKIKNHNLDLYVKKDNFLLLLSIVFEEIHC